MKMSEIYGQNQDIDMLIQDLIGKLNNYDGLNHQKTRKKLIQIGKPAVPYLIPALSSPSEHLRWEATLILGEIGDPDAAEALVTELQDESANVRWTAMESLITLDRAAILPLLFALRKDFGSVRLREGAHHVFHILKDRGHLLPPIIKVFKALESIEPDMKVPWAVEHALEELNITIKD
jgi:HEAT repeat protein